MNPRPKASPRFRRVRGSKVLRRYGAAPLGTRLFLCLRWIWTPYGKMASLFPYRGKILDGGSGHGLFSLALALQSSHRKVSGIDHSRLRVKIAQEAGAGLPGLRFTEGNYAGLPGGPWDGIALVDVLHYLPRSQQAKLFHRAFRSLRPGGLFLFREVDRSPGALSFLNRLHEKLMTGLGFTKAEGLYLRSREEWMDLASEAGFQLRSHPVGRFPFADVLFLGRKP